MPICVDPLFSTDPTKSPNWRFRESCHMMTDDISPAGIDDLHRLARRLALKPGWVQPGPHYDLTRSKRERAVSLGARELSSLEFGMACVVPWARYWRDEREAQVVHPHQLHEGVCSLCAEPEGAKHTIVCPWIEDERAARRVERT